ncbi:MAG: TAXI family TRAP transporter solute-binding subunit [Isosphaeraceae bacterium]
MRAILNRLCFEWVMVAVVACVMLSAILIYWNATSPRPARLRITAGSPDGLRHQIALRLTRAAKRQGITLDVVPASGSEDALDRVDQGLLDLALAQGGLEQTGREHVRQIASLKIEPLHLVVKSELLPPSGEVLGLDFLRGRRVNLSERGSGTYELAREVLAFAGLNGKVATGPLDYAPTTWSYHDLMTETDRERLPDAAFMVSALPSPVVRHLLNVHDYQLVPLRFGEAFALDALQAGPPPSVTRAMDPAASQVNRGGVYHTEIPAYTYGVTPPSPPLPVPTFGTRLLLVGHAQVDASVIARLLEAALTNGPGAPVLDESLLDLSPEFDWHEGVMSYRDRNKPLMIGDLDFLDKGAGLVGVLVPGAFYVWHLLRKWTRRRQELGFESYMLKVAEVEREAVRIELAGRIDLTELVRLRLSLCELKDEALRKFARGELEGHELISGFVTHVNDARDHLTRLILHERDNLEEEATREGRPHEVAWNTAIARLDPAPVATEDAPH